MKRLIYLAALGLTAVSAHAQTIQINEIRNDSDLGPDFEYFEILNTTGGPLPLDGLTFLAIGDGSGGSGVIEEATTLTSTDLGGGETWLVAEILPMNFDTFGDSSIDLTISTADQTEALGFENNDNITYLLVRGFFGAVGNDLDLNDDGILDATPWTAVVDAVSITDPDSSDQTYATALGGQLLGPVGDNSPPHIFRPPGDSNWIIGELGTLSTVGTTDILANTDDTPGGVNPAATGVSIFSVVPNTIAESSFDAVTVTLGRPGTTGDIDVFVSVDDESEAILDPFITESTVTIPDGQPFTTFDIFAVDDAFPDGDQTVTISAFARGGFPVTATLTVTDDPGDSFELIINELNIIPQEDVNGDGTVNNADEFVEIINTSGGQVDLSGYTLRDEGDLLHTFRDGTLLEDGCAIVVFGDFGVTIGSTGLFGTAEVQVVSEGASLQLTDTGDQISILDPLFNEVYSVNTPDWSTSATLGSYNLSPDATATASVAYAGHSVVAGGPTLQSPGTTPAGADYCQLSDSLVITTSVSTISESAGAGAVTVTVALPGSTLGADLKVFAFSLDSTEISVPGGGAFATGTITAGQTSTNIVFNVENDSDVDGSQLVTVVGGGSGFLNGTAVVTVEDDGDVALDGDLFISEYAEGSSNNKYIEIYNPTSVEIDLAGYLIGRTFNGASGSLEGFGSFATSATIAPGEVYVVANASADPTILAAADETNGLINFNGDDGIFLLKGTQSSFEILDGVGDQGADPGSGWDVAGVSNGTANQTLVRKSSVTGGNTDWDGSRGTTTENSEWIVFASNTWDDLGMHTFGGVGPGITITITITTADFAGGAFTLGYATVPASSQVDIYRLTKGAASWIEVAGGDDTDGTFVDSSPGPAALYQVVAEGGDAPANP